MAEWKSQIQMDTMTNKTSVCCSAQRHKTMHVAILATLCTVVSRKYAPLFCMLASGKTGEGAYARDRNSPG